MLFQSCNPTDVFCRISKQSVRTAITYGEIIEEDLDDRRVICKHGNTQPRFVTVTLHREDCIVILKQVPADVCDNCGEYYLSESVTEEVLKRAEAAIEQGAEVEIMRYAA